MVALGAVGAAGGDDDGGLGKGHDADAMVDGAAGQAVALDGLLPQEAQLLLSHGDVGLVGQLPHGTTFVVIPGPTFEEDQGTRVGIFHDTS